MLFLFLLAAFQQPAADSLYSHSEYQCMGSIYTVTRNWNLTLKEQGTFHLKYIKRDSRYERKPALDFQGTWKRQMIPLF